MITYLIILTFLSVFWSVSAIFSFFNFSWPSFVFSAIDWIASLLAPVFLFIPLNNFINALNFFFVFLSFYIPFRIFIFLYSRGSASEL